MSSHHDHAMHEHHHGGVAHEPSADWRVAYRKAYDAAQPDPGRRVVAVDLEARAIDWTFTPGAPVRAWGYNGQIPGPTLEGRVGDVLQVRFTNRLEQPTTIHWHGLRVPAAMDGTEMVQWPVAPGETFTYRFRLPDAGTFWYHPHSNETVQLEMGLYGALIVRGADEPQLDAPVTVTEALLATADRLDLAVGPFSAGQELAVEALPYFRKTIRKRQTERFATVKVGPAKPSTAVIPGRLRTIAPLAAPSMSP